MVYFFKLIVAGILAFACFGNSVQNVNVKIEIGRDSVPPVTMQKAKNFAYSQDEKVIVKPTEEILDFEFDNNTGKMIFSNNKFIKYFDVRFPIYLKISYWKQGQEERETLRNGETAFTINRIAIKKLGLYNFTFYQQEGCIINYHVMYLKTGKLPSDEQEVYGQKICR
jgi:hypothetical protein